MLFFRLVRTELHLLTLNSWVLQHGEICVLKHLCTPNEKFLFEFKNKLHKLFLPCFAAKQCFISRRVSDSNTPV